MKHQLSTDELRRVVIQLAHQLGARAVLWIKIHGKGIHSTIEDVAGSIPADKLPGAIRQLEFNIDKHKRVNVN